ncbi:MAG: hypothetical protein C9355_04825 [Thalassolituus maritimus]|nr:MAG: hypothetical protein C9355_04825 [Thalassolituus maritimus]
MYKKASLVVDYHLNNKIFDIDDCAVNRDDYGYSIWLLKERLKAKGYELSTCDINRPSDSELVIYFDYPATGIENPSAINILCLFENEIIKPENTPSPVFDQFDYVFSWNDDYLEKRNFRKFNYTHKLNRPYNFRNYPGFTDRKLCTLISANKMTEHPRELYSERLKAIAWFENNAAEDFDLYGVGWDQFPNDGRLRSRVLNKLAPFTNFMKKSYPSYKGMVESKNQTLRNYRYSICFENASGYPGYISEKLFDSLMAGCVPIYYGAPNVADYIPEGCYIDFRDFTSYHDLYDYLIVASSDEFYSRQREIESFLNSERSSPFEAQRLPELILKCLEEH